MDGRQPASIGTSLEPLAAVAAHLAGEAELLQDRDRPRHIRGEPEAQCRQLGDLRRRLAGGGCEQHQLQPVRRLGLDGLAI